MDKRIKVLVVLNCISYGFMGIIAYFITSGLINNFSNGIKFVIGIAPFISIFFTSFIAADYYYKDFKSIKKEAVIDLLIRIASWILVFYWFNNYSNIKKELIILVLAFLLNCIIEYLISIKISNLQQEYKEKIIVTDEEKSNIRTMVAAINKQMISLLIFIGVGLSVPVTKNMKGTTENWFIPVMFSVFVFTWFINMSYKNYTNFYLDADYSKKIFIRDVIFLTIGYSLSLILSFFKFSESVYAGIEFIGILFTMPSIITMRKMSCRLKQIKDSLGKDKYNNSIINKNN